jgi:hypothetical protein
MLQRLDVLGRFEMDNMSSGVDPARIYPETVGPFFADATADPSGFTADLRSLVANDHESFARYGASCLVWELLSEHGTLDALALLDGAIAFKRERGLPSAHLKGYEWSRWVEVNGPGNW